jgi:hypothetical protein
VTARILFSLYLVLANTWCLASCVLPASASGQKQIVPPCHQNPSQDSQSSDEHKKDCSNPMFSLLDGATAKQADLDHTTVFLAALPVGFAASPSTCLYKSPALVALHTIARPPGITVLRI